VTSISKRLQDDAETRESRERSSFIAETQSRVEGEPDLEKRLAILEDALRRYPGEPQLERLWGLTREKRNLVNSILGLARLYEQGGQYSEALGQWQTLQIIHSGYPGLDSEIARVEKLRARRGDPETAKYDEDNIAGGRQTDNPLTADEFEEPGRSWDKPEENPERLEDRFASYPSDYQSEPRPQPKSELREPTWLRNRRSRLDELARLEIESERTADPAVLEKVYDRLESISREYSGDQEFQHPLARARRRLSEAAKRLGNEYHAEVPGPPAQGEASGQKWAHSTQAPKATDSHVPRALDEFPSGRRGARGWHEGSGPNIWNQHPHWLLAGASTLVMVILAGILGALHSGHQASSVGSVAPEIATLPEEGAAKGKRSGPQNAAPAPRSGPTELPTGEPAAPKGRDSGSTQNERAHSPNLPARPDAAKIPTSTSLHQPDVHQPGIDLGSGPPPSSPELPSVERIKVFNDANSSSGLHSDCDDFDDQTDFQYGSVHYIKFCISLIGSPASSGTLGVKYTAPDGTTQRVTPADVFTFTRPLVFDSVGSNTVIRGLGNVLPGSLRVGTWRIEFWWGTLKIAERSFRIE